MSTMMGEILNPKLLTSLKDSLEPIQCIVWKGGKYEKISFDLYPFDTLETLKRNISTHYKDIPYFHINYIFVGIPLGWEKNTEPTIDTRYLPADYYWIRSAERGGTNVDLSNPRKSILKPDKQFITPDGSFPELLLENLGKGTIEDVILKEREIVPDFHVYTLHDILAEYSGQIPIPESVWNSRIALYFPNLTYNDPHEPTTDDIDFTKTLSKFVKNHTKKLDTIETLIRDETTFISSDIQLSGIKYLRLNISGKNSGFEGIETLFYRLSVTEKRPFIRLLPSFGNSNMTKIHTKGVLPIPSIDQPSLILQWAQELSPTPDYDFMYIKYLFKQGTDISPSIYGTLRSFSDGSVDLVIQPPKNIRKLDPLYDFTGFDENLLTQLNGIHDSLNYHLENASVIFKLKVQLKSDNITKKTLQKRLLMFQPLLQEIVPLKDQQTLISLRYKGVGFYYSENKYFSFLTQYATDKFLDGEHKQGIIRAMQEEFEVSVIEARNMFEKWLSQKDEVVRIPKGDMIENFNSGIDIHIFSEHPIYLFHINRVNTVKNLQRIMTLLSLLFVDDGNIEAVSLDKVTNSSTLEETVDSKYPKENGQHPESKVFASESAVSSSNMGDDIMELLREQGEIGTETGVEIETRAETGAETGAETDVEIGTETRHSPKQMGDVNPKNWFVNRLHEIDPDLFSFTPLEGKKTYSRLCQVTNDKQPVIMTEDQYQKMRDEYRNDEDRGEIAFVEFPLRGKRNPYIPYEIKEIYTVMKYGSKPHNQNYYMCPYLYCIYDNIMVRPKDFKASVNREGKKKQPNTCPFCGGKEYDNRTKRVKMEGYSIIRRKSKRGTPAQLISSFTAPVRVGFHSKTTHPQGLYLPCCFLEKEGRRGVEKNDNSDEGDGSDVDEEEDRVGVEERGIMKLKHTELKLIRYKSKQFDRIRKILGEDVLNDDRLGDVEKRQETHYVNYQGLLKNISTEYILNPEKFPLEAGKFALLPKILGDYFSQNSTDIAERLLIRTTLLPNSEGFVRMGVEYSETESVLSIFAPLLGKNTIEEVKQLILEKYIPKIFIHANFGNMVNEYFEPSDKEPTDNELRIWASDNLHVKINSDNMTSLSKIYRSHKRFQTFIRDTGQKKELRHIVPLVMQKKVLSNNGILPVIIQYNSSVSCPPYGVSDYFRDADISFIIQNGNVFELLVYSKNKQSSGEDPEKHETIIKWHSDNRDKWPGIVLKRSNEFINSCESRHMSLFTSQSGIDPLAIPPLSYAIHAMPYTPEGIIRDAYNHLVGLTFQPIGVGRDDEKGLVAVPVIDDGTLVGLDSGLDYKIHFDWSDYTPSSVNNVEFFYKNAVAPTMMLYPGILIKCAIARREQKDKEITDCETGEILTATSEVIALKLKNGLFIPSSQLKEGKSSQLRVGYVDEFEWEINQKLSVVTNCASGKDMFKISGKDIDETYQIFRLMVSNWISGDGPGPEGRKTVEQIIFSGDLPDYEKRKRLNILLAPVFSKWFHPSKNTIDTKEIMRRDCRIISTEGACKNTCEWVDNNCLLKIQETTVIGDIEVSTTVLYTKRVIDELIRYPAKRNEILNKRISVISKITEPLQKEDQLLIPENIPSPFAFLHIHWSNSEDEIPKEYKKFYEEMSSEPSKDENIGVLDDRSAIPTDIQNFIGDSDLFYWKVVENMSFMFVLLFRLGLSPADIGLKESDTKFTKESIEEISKKTLKSVIVLDSMSETGPDLQVVKSSHGVDKVIIIILEKGGIGFLTDRKEIPYINIEKIPGKIKKIFDETVPAVKKRILKITRK